MLKYIFLVLALLVSINSYAKDYTRYKDINGNAKQLGCSDSCVARGGDAKSCNRKCGIENTNDYNDRNERGKYDNRYDDRRKDRYRDKYDDRYYKEDTDRRKKDEFDGINLKCFKKCKNIDVSYYDCLDICEY